MTNRNVLGHAVVEIEGDSSKLSKEIDKAKTKAQGLGSVMKTSLGTAAGFAGAQLGLQGVSSAFDFLIGNAMDFEASLDGVQAATGATEDAMGKMRKEALRIGKDTSKSASEAVEAMGELAKAGMSVEEILNGGADAAVALAEATGIDVPRAAVLVSNALNIWKDGSIDAKDAANLFAKAANASAISVDDLGMSLGAVGPILPSVGMSMEDFAVTMGLMGNNAMRGSDAGTSLKAMLSGFTPVSDKAKDSMAALGFSAFDAAGNFESMPVILDRLKKSLEGMTEEQRAATLELWFGSDGLRAANILLKEGSEGWDKFTKSMAEAPDVAEQARIRMDNLKGQIEKLKGSLETLSITIGTLILPVLLLLAEGATKAVDAILKFIETEEVKGILTAIGEGFRTIAEVVGELAGMLGLTEEHLILLLVPLAALAIAVAPAALLIVGLLALVAVIGTLSADLDKLPEPLLRARLAFYEFAASIIEVADNLPGWARDVLGIRDATNEVEKALDSEIRMIKDEIIAREGATAAAQRAIEVTDMVALGQQLAATAGRDYKDVLLEQIQAYVGLDGPSGTATDQLWKLYDAYIQNGGAAKDLGFEVDALTGAISKVDAPADEAALSIDGVTQSVDGLITKGPSAQRALRDQVGTEMAKAAIQAWELHTGGIAAAEGIDAAAASSGQAVGNIQQIAEAARAAGLAAQSAGEAFRRLAATAWESAASANNAGNSIGIPGGGTQFGGWQAEGGIVRAGEMSIVGERGWEPFIPAVDGRILSHEDAMAALSGEQGGSGIQVLMPNATINARNEREAWESMQNVGYGISTAAALRGVRR